MKITSSPLGTHAETLFEDNDRFHVSWLQDVSRSRRLADLVKAGPPASQKKGLIGLISIPTSRQKFAINLGIKRGLKLKRFSRLLLENP